MPPNEKQDTGDQTATKPSGTSSPQQSADGEKDAHKRKRELRTVGSTSSHGVDLNDGRPLMPGETASDVNVLDPHNAALIEDGHIIVIKEGTES